MENFNWKKNTILFLSSQTVSMLGSMLVQYAITWHITLKTQSGIMMTISILCGFLPTLLISPFAGVWADRYSRKMLIVLSDSFIAVSTLALAILFILGYDAIWLLFLASALRSFGAGIQTPSVGALLPQIVPEDKLTRINGINSSIQSIVSLVSPLLSGALMGAGTIQKIFFIDVFTAAIAVSILIFFLKVSKHAKALEDEQLSYFADMKEGIKYIYHHSFISRVFIHCGIYFVLISPLAFLTPLQVARNFGDDVWLLTVIEVTFSIGMIVGGIAIALWGGFKNRLNTIVLSILIMAAFTLALGVISSFVVYSVIMAFIGLLMPFINTPFTVLLQEKVEENYMGRVFGVLSMISSSVMPLAMLIFGPLSDFVRIEWLLIGTGLLLLIQGFLMIRSKTLYRESKPA